MAAGSSSAEPGAARPIGPGRVVLVVGPSGAGKDAVIGAARAQLAGDGGFAFPTRVVTRAPNAAEDHATLSRQAFEAQLAEAAFALHWEAHGLLYGIPRTIDGDVGEGRTVLFNASRSAIGAARRRYGRVGVVLIDAPPEVRAARLAARGREQGQEIAARVERVVAGFSAAEVDLAIDNSGTLAQACGSLCAWLLATRR